MCLYLRWLICCPNVAALVGKRCSKLLAAQKVSQNSKSCQKVAEHNLYRSIALSTYTENLAAGKTTAQSSTYTSGAGGQAWKAVDGNPDTEFANGHCSHTKSDPSPSWWRVDLGSNNVPVYEVHIVNRFSQLDSVRQRSRNYIISLGKYFISLLRQTLDSSKRAL